MSWSTNKTQIQTVLTGYTETQGEPNEEIEDLKTGQHKVYSLRCVGMSKDTLTNNIVVTTYNAELKIVYNHKKESYDTNIDSLDTLCTSLAQLAGFGDFTSDITFEPFEDYFGVATITFEFGKEEG